jgi:hypothetical protein
MAVQMITTDFMLQLHKQLMEKTYGKENHRLSETTASAYLKTLFMLNDKKAFKNLVFLKNKEEIEKKLSGYAESTQKTIVASIASVLSLYKDKPTYKAIYKFYYDKMMEKSKLAGGADTAEKTETQKENWISWDEVKEKQKDLSGNVLKFVENKTISPTEFKHLLDQLVLSLYTEVPPRRNQDYLSMSVLRTSSDKFAPGLDTYKDKNFVVVRKGVPVEFVFNKYKTSKKYGTQKVAIPETLGTVINNFLKFHPSAKDKKVKEFEFLVNMDGSPITAGNAITRVLNRIFAKKIGSSMLRHIYLSNKMDIADMKADATAMGHSLAEQQKYLKQEEVPPSPPLDAGQE